MILPKPGERVGGRYRLVDRLGLGGMGEVWLATLEGAGTFRRTVVVKFLPLGRSEDDRLVSMLSDEARILGLLHHPNIVAPVDFVVDGDGPVLVLEHIDGPSLRTALRLARRTRQPLTESLAAWVGAEVARALHAAHTALDETGQPLNLIHRDVSPDNILLSRRGQVRLADFGVARAAGNSDVTAPGSAPKGKRGYMAPEQAAGQPLTPAADQFGLARVIAEAADVHCGPALRMVLDRATAPDPADRFPTAQRLADELGHVCQPPADPAGALSAWLRAVCPELVGAPADGPASAPPKPASRRFRIELPVTPRPPTTPRPGEPRRPDPTETPPELRRLGVSRPSQPPAEAAPQLERLPLLVPPDPLDPPDRPDRRRATAGRRGLPQFALESTNRGWDVPTLGAAVLLILAVGAPLLWSAFVRAPERMPEIGAPAPLGELSVQSKPEGAEVYVDGVLRGTAPLRLQLSFGRHELRVGSVQLERWRAASVEVKAGAEERVVVELSGGPARP